MRSEAVKYAIALAALAMAVLVRGLLDPVMGDSYPLTTLFGAIALAVWVGGYRPALLVAALGYVTADYLFIEPRGSLGLNDARNLFGLVTYLLTSSMIIVFGEATRVSSRRWQDLRRQLNPAQPPVPSGVERIHRKHNLRDVVVIGFALTLAVLVAGGVFGYLNARRTIRNFRLVAHSRQVIEGLEALLSALKDAETGQRGFLLTDDASYLQPYETALRNAPAELARIRDLTSDDAAQRARLALLEARVAARLDELRRTVAMLERGDHAAALQIVRSNAGKTLMNDVRNGVAGMQDAERALLELRASESEASSRITLLMIPLSALMGVILVGIVFYLSQRSVNERQRVSDALEEADRRKDEFLATLAHELRNPLAPIRSAVQILVKKGSPDPELRWTHDVIDRQVRHMARLLDDLLDASRISHNKLELRREVIELADVVRHAVETSRPLIDGTRNELAIALPKEPIYLDADPVRLAQVFSNLLNNAAKYSGPDGHILLSGERRGGDVVVSVKDDGMGIAGEILPRVFDLFSQSRQTLEHSQGGLGIGLSLVRGLVALHGGDIQVKSDGPGTGTEAIVRLPAVVGRTVREIGPSDDNVEQTDSPTYRLLIVDDVKDNADSLARLWTVLGHEVHTAYDGEQAVAAAESFRPGVVLLDLGLPGLTGYDACRHIRRRPWGKEMVLIAVTGRGQDDDRRRTTEAGFDHHLVKPVSPAAVLSFLASRPEDSRT